MIGNLLELKPNKISVDLVQYSMIIMGDTGIGKTTTLMKFLDELSDDTNKRPLFLEFEDRFQNIPNIVALKINDMPELKSVIAQLKNPEFKNRYSCIIIDTVDKFEEFCERYVTTNADAEIIKDVGAFGEGTTRFKSALRKISEIQALGFPVHFIAQSSHIKDFESKQESESLKLNKNTMSYVREGAFLVGYMYKKTVNKKDERFITFAKTKEFPNLKDTFELPTEINFKDLKKVWTDTIIANGGEFTTSDKTIDKMAVVEDFNTIKNKGIELGGLLAAAGKLDEATAVLKKHLGINEDGNVKMFDDLRESQIELTKVIVMDLQTVVDKFKLS